MAFPKQQRIELRIISSERKNKVCGLTAPVIGRFSFTKNFHNLDKIAYEFWKRFVDVQKYGGESFPKFRR